MAGYSTMAEVRGGRVRAIPWATDAGRARPEASPGVEHARVETPPVRARPRETLGERWAGLREELGMMTFFLLDPESWR